MDARALKVLRGIFADHVVEVFDDPFDVEVFEAEDVRDLEHAASALGFDMWAERDYIDAGAIRAPTNFEMARLAGLRNGDGLG